MGIYDCSNVSRVTWLSILLVQLFDMIFFSRQAVKWNLVALSLFCVLTQPPLNRGNLNSYLFSWLHASVASSARLVAWKLGVEKKGKKMKSPKWSRVNAPQIWYSDSCNIARYWSPPPWRVSRCKLIRNTARSVAVFHGSQATTKGGRKRAPLKPGWWWLCQAAHCCF